MMADLTAERAAELRQRIEALYPSIQTGIAEADRHLAAAAAMGAIDPQCTLTYQLPPDMVHAISIAFCIAMGMTTEGEEARDEIYQRGWRLLNGAK